MAGCSGCGNRQNVLKGAYQQLQKPKPVVQQAQVIAKRVGVVGQHAARDIGRVMRSALPRGR
jgi:hypothetical protein